MTDLECRIRRLEDRAELQELVTQYFLAVDDDDYEMLATTFSPDGTFSAGSFEGATGRDAVVESLRSSRKLMGPTVHTPNYALFKFQEDGHATGLVGAHLELSMAGRTLFGAVRYTDEYVRVDERWQFQRRNMRTIHMGPWEDVGTSLTSELCVRWPGIDPLPSDYPKKTESGASDATK